MKNFIIVLCLICFNSIAAFTDGPKGKIHKKKRFSCPKVTTIDCMPVVKPENAKFCTPEMRAKIEKSCAGIQYLD